MPGKNGFDLVSRAVTTSRSRAPGTYYLSLHSFGLEAINHNPGTGLALGNAPVHSGDYLDLQNIYLFGWETGLHITSMAMSRLWNVTIEGDSGNPTDYGIVLDGGSENSHLFAGVSAGNCTTGLYLNTTSQGNVYMLGDFGVNGTHVLENVDGANGVFIGGNFEGPIPTASSASMAIATTSLSNPATTSAAAAERALSAQRQPSRIFIVTRRRIWLVPLCSSKARGISL